jgi:dUTPase
MSVSDQFRQFQNIILGHHDKWTTKKVAFGKFMHISLYIDSSDETLKQMYITAAKNHNDKIINDPRFYDAGFDLFLPVEYVTAKPGCNKFDFNIKCCAKIISGGDMINKHTYTPFYTYARSSISKTCLRLANNQGIIDAGYRGSLIGMFDNISGEDWNIQPYSRLLQICAPNLMPIFINIVDTFDELGPSTNRGEGGLGSTGV